MSVEQNLEPLREQHHRAAPEGAGSRHARRAVRAAAAGRRRHARGDGRADREARRLPGHAGRDHAPHRGDRRAGPGEPRRALGAEHGTRAQGLPRRPGGGPAPGGRDARGGDQAHRPRDARAAAGDLRRGQRELPWRCSRRSSAAARRASSSRARRSSTRACRCSRSPRARRTSRSSCSRAAKRRSPRSRWCSRSSSSIPRPSACWTRWTRRWTIPNTERFCDLVRQMSAQTQFLFITHNKITMELAEPARGRHDARAGRLTYRGSGHRGGDGARTQASGVMATDEHR